MCITAEPCLSLEKGTDCRPLCGTFIHVCRNANDMKILKKRVVDIASDDRFVTFYPPDLTTVPVHQSFGMKDVTHGVPPGTPPDLEESDINEHFRMGTDGKTRLMPPCTIVITESKVNNFSDSRHPPWLDVSAACMCCCP